MKACPIIIVLFVTSACTSRPKAWKVLDFGAFTLKTPGGWRIVKMQGTDSYFGGLTNGTDSLWFDYGRYDVDLGSDSSRWRRVAEDTVNGFLAVFSVPDTLGHGDVSMNIPMLTGGNRFTIWASDVTDQAIVMQIYKSVMFRGSTSSLNPPIRDVNKFDRTNADGQSLFVMECGSCHMIRGIVEGPRIRSLLATRSADWLYRFFTDRRARAVDSPHQALKKAFNNVDCVEFPNMTKSQAVALFYYIKSK